MPMQGIAKCAKCGKTFRTHPYKLRRYSFLFCCPEHVDYSLCAHRTRKKKYCRYCHQRFLPRSGRERTSHWCSLKCNAASRRNPFILKGGYRLLLRPWHPRANSKGYVREHIIVAENMLGRSLVKGEVVHHRDGDGTHHSKSNLQVFPSNGEHIRQCHLPIGRARAKRKTT